VSGPRPPRRAAARRPRGGATSSGVAPALRLTSDIGLNPQLLPVAAATSGGPLHPSRLHGSLRRGAPIVEKEQRLQDASGEASLWPEALLCTFGCWLASLPLSATGNHVVGCRCPRCVPSPRFRQSGVLPAQCLARERAPAQPTSSQRRRGPRSSQTTKRRPIFPLQRRVYRRSSERRSPKPRKE
jgi:hypothetical protein